MMRTRLAVPTAVLIGLALVPTLLHSYVDLRTDDGFTATAVDGQLAGLRSRPTDRRAGWAKKTLDSDDWSERRYEKPDGGNVTLFVSRSYDLKRLYHHPELAVAYGHDMRDNGIRRLAVMAEVPVHVLRANDDQGAGLALYALLYDGQFVDNPYTFQIRAAGELLFSPRRAMTLFFAHDETAPAHASVDDAVAARVLTAAIRSFQSQTPSARTVRRQREPSPAAE
jgi:hypothetical protein